MTFHILANLDQEAQWLGAGPLSRRAQATLSAYASLLAALAPSDDATVWVPAAVDVKRLPRSDRWQPPAMRIGTPPSVDLAWADRDAKAVNDRRFALQLVQAFGHGLPGARVIHSIAELETHLAAGGAAASPNGAWVCKALWSSAGRERVYGAGPTVAWELRSQLQRLLQHSGGAVVFEPWVARLCDVGLCGSIADTVTFHPPHGLLSSPRGGFAGIDLAATQLERRECEALVAVGNRIAVALAQAGYRGPFGIDAFVYLDGQSRRLHPLCEINARYTFGHVARALGARLGIATLQFARAAPPGARVLVAPGSGDAASVWATDA